MGDKRMAEIVTSDGSLYVYTHSGGSTLPDDARAAIAFARPRWDDESYAVRIIVDQLTREDRDGLLGSGLMLRPNAEDEYNDDNPSVIIDLVRRVLIIVEDGEVVMEEFA